MNLMRSMIWKNLTGGSGGGGGADLNQLKLYAADYEDEPPAVTSGAVNGLHGYIVGH